MGSPVSCFGISVFMLFFVTITVAEFDFKTKFGQELGDAMRKYNAEMAQSNLDHLSAFYNTLLDKIPATPKEQRAWNLRLDTIKEMKNRIGDSINEETMKMSKQFAKIVFWEIMLYQGLPAISGDPAKLKIMKDALEKCAHEENEDIREFQQKLYGKWSDMYKTIPAVELQKHAEYAEINQLIESHADVDILNNGEDTKEAVENMQAALKKMTEFFDFKEYKFLFEKHHA